MRIISRKKIKDFYETPKYADSEQPLKAWFLEVNKENWKSFHDIKMKYRHASIVGNDRVVFNIKGNKYRLVAMVNFNFQICYIRFLGTHENYDKINVKEV